MQNIMFFVESSVYCEEKSCSTGALGSSSSSSSSSGWMTRRADTGVPSSQDRALANPARRQAIGAAGGASLGSSTVKDTDLAGEG